MIPLDWRIAAYEPIVWPARFWMREIREFRSFVVYSSDSGWGFLVGLMDMASGDLALRCEGIDPYSNIIQVPYEGRVSLLELPEPHLPDAWFTMEYEEQMVILEKTMRDIRRGVWESDIVPWLKTLK